MTTATTPSGSSGSRTGVPATPEEPISAAALAPAPRRRPAGRGFRARVLTPYAMLAPAILLFLAFMAAPIVYTVILSFQRVQVQGLGLGSGARTTVFAGLSNYVAALDAEFLASVGRVLLYGLILVPTMLGLALLFALLLDSKRSRATRFSRLVIFLPYAVPGVIASLLWGFLYLPAVSPFYFITESLGIEAPTILSSGLIVFGLANIGLWGGVGFNMVVIYTSLKAVPSDIYEAARLDGCSEIQIALRIKIPIVFPALVMTGLFSLIATLQVFAEPTTLRPLTNALSTTWSPLMKVYRDAFTRDDLGSASATSVVIAVVSLALSFVFLRIVQKRAFGQED